MTKTENELLADELARADHARACYARALEKMRIMLVNVHDGLEDEGDRIYLGSTNHADLLREAWTEADALQWDEVLAHTQPETTLAATNLRLQEELAALRTEQPASPASEAGEVDRADITAWLVENCGTGLPYESATDLKTALHGAAYVLRQIEGTDKYTVHIGQSGPASSGIRWLLEYVARNELAKLEQGGAGDAE